MTHPNDEQGQMQCEFTTSMAQHAVVAHSDHGLTNMTCVVCNACEFTASMVHGPAI